MCWYNAIEYLLSNIYNFVLRNISQQTTTNSTQFRTHFF
nr:MAG TPA: hypothetical protein [Caudoviricetes sp.]